MNGVQALEAHVRANMRGGLAAYQLEMLNRQLLYARTHSRFYRARLAGCRLPLASRAALRELPFTTPADLRGQGMAFCCTPASRIHRIVTLRTSGSSGAVKRVFFTAADLERTVAFFAAGMQVMTAPGERTLIFMPAAEDGIADLLSRGLRRFGAEPYVYGALRDYDDAARACAALRPACIVGVPAQMRRLALQAPQLAPRSLLLSADYIAESLCASIRRHWASELFGHWGMTETGYGGAVECPAHDGWHIRHDELLLEVIDPASGAPLPPGSRGELVVTTLRREAAPLLRYRTGDEAVLVDAPCACGSDLPRLQRVFGRLAGRVSLPMGGTLSIHMLDELLFADDDVLDFTATLARDGLHLALLARCGAALARSRARLAAVLPGLPVFVAPGDGFATAGVAKRSLTLAGDG